jgi:hypothetical protein
LQQGEQAINRGASASGNLYSTSTLLGLNNYAQGAASQQYQGYVSNLMNLANLGQGATNATAQAGLSTANNVSAAQLGVGNAQASGILGSSGAMSSGILGAAGAFNSALGNSNLFGSLNSGTLQSAPNYQVVGADSTGLGYLAPTTSGVAP